MTVSLRDVGLCGCVTVSLIDVGLCSIVQAVKVTVKRLLINNS